MNGRRGFAAAEARGAGRGGILAVLEITGVARCPIGRALKEMLGEAPRPRDQVRRHGGVRKPLLALDPTQSPDLQKLLDPVREAIRSRRFSGAPSA